MVTYSLSWGTHFSWGPKDSFLPLQKAQTTIKKLADSNANAKNSFTAQKDQQSYLNSTSPAFAHEALRSLISL